MAAAPHGGDDRQVSVRSEALALVRRVAAEAASEDVAPALPAVAGALLAVLSQPGQAPELARA